MTPRCDWWIQRRNGAGKCRNAGTEYVEDADGAPYHFCRKHRAQANLQYQSLEAARA